MCYYTIIHFLVTERWQDQMLRRHTKSFAKYGFVGVIFTLIGPLLFLALAEYVPRTIAILISEPLLYAAKFLVYRAWVYRAETVNLPRYIYHVLPLYIISFSLVRITQSSLTSLQAIILVVIVNGFIGYFWGSFLYSRPPVKRP